MEKVKIKTCTNSGKEITNKNGEKKPVINIELEDGRTGAAFDTAFLGLPIGQEIEIEIKPAKVYNNVQQYYFLMPGENTGNKKGNFQKDWTLEKKRIALECATSLGCNNSHSAEKIKENADLFFNWLNQKS